jgi:hypothetical protein
MMASGGDWLLLQELLERGDPEFIDRLRGVIDADALGRFAERWYADPSPNARRLLLAYLEGPLNAYRHEAPVKRLFKRAEAAGDDSIMARFLVAFDRSIRREVRVRHRVERRRFETPREREQLIAHWKARGIDRVAVWETGPWTERVLSSLEGSGQFIATASWSESYFSTPGDTTMPRGQMVRYCWPFGRFEAPDWVGKLKLRPPREYRDATAPPESERAKLERFRLFSVSTRQYLRRRAWRYFRRLGKTQPERYVAAISEALALYEDSDVNSGLALIDNWGLIHALFHNSPVLVARPRGWILAEDRTLAELEPAPIYEELWRSTPKALFDLLLRAHCRPVRHWSVRMLRHDMAAARAAVGIEEIIGLLTQDDPEVVELAVEWLRGAREVSSVRPERWLAIAETASPGALEILAEIMARQIAPERIAIETAARLAAARHLPLARLGLGWLKVKTPTSDDERRGLLTLLEAECEPLRPELLAWLRSVLSSTPEFHADWLLEFLDSRHADARAEGIRWFRDEARARDDVALWRRLMESPHDDVRLALSADLAARVKQARGDGTVDLSLALDPDRLRLLWASVLLNVNRGNRVKPRVVEQVARRLARRPDEAELLLPLLAVGLRSLRAPERRAALAAVVRLVEGRPEATALVQKSLPELQWA